MTLQTLYEEALGNHKRGDLAAAERLYREVLESAPTSFVARHMLGVLRAQAGAPDPGKAMGETPRVSFDTPSAAGVATTSSGQVITAGLSCGCACPRYSPKNT